MKQMKRCVTYPKPFVDSPTYANNPPFECQFDEQRNIFGNSNPNIIQYEIFFYLIYNQMYVRIDGCEQNPTEIEVPRHREQSRFYNLLSSKSKRIGRIWSMIYRLSRTKFDINNPIHIDGLNSLFQYFTIYNEKVEAPPLSLKDDRWQNVLGFQTSEPVNDFRGGGILNVLLPLFMLEKCPTVAKAIVAATQDREKNRPMMLMMISLVSAAVECAEETNLISLSSKSEIAEKLEAILSIKFISINHHDNNEDDLYINDQNDNNISNNNSNNNIEYDINRMFQSNEDRMSWMCFVCFFVGLVVELLDLIQQCDLNLQVDYGAFNEMVKRAVKEPAKFVMKGAEVTSY